MNENLFARSFRVPLTGAWLHAWRRGVFACLVALGFFLCGAAQAQWVAYDDYTAGTGTAANATRWGSLISGNGIIASYPLKNIVNGTNLPVVLLITNRSAAASSGATGPVAGTPAYTNFNGNVDLTGNIPVIGSGAILAHVFTNLNLGERYSFRGTAMRGNSLYTYRWVLCWLEGAASFRSAHSTNVLSSASTNIPAGILAPNEAALNSGFNNTGDIVDWEDIIPGSNRTLVIYSQMYTNRIPASYGVPGNYATNKNYSYSLMGVRFEDQGPSQLVVLSQPQSLSLCDGQPGTLSVNAQGGEPLFFQWRKDGTNIAWGTNQSFSIPSATTNDAGDYRVIISNFLSSVTSSVASVTVTQAPPVLASPPANQTGCLSNPVALMVTAYGTPPITYQWRFNETDLPGQTNSSYLITSATLTDAGNYSVLVSNALGTAATSNATLQLLPSYPAIVVPPASQTVITGAVVQLSVAAESCQPFNCQWQFNHTNLVAATNFTLVLSNVQPVHAGSYRVVLSNSFGMTTSEDATLALFTVLGEALNCTNVAWTNGATTSGSTSWGPSTSPTYTMYYSAGSAASRWLVESNVTHDGVTALQSAAVSGFDASILRTTMSGPAKLSFWWKISVPDSNAVLLFVKDRVSILTTSRATNWEQRTVYLSAGSSTYEWDFLVNGSTNQPVAWLDEVAWTTNGLEPYVITAPQSVALPIGSNATFSVTANGFPPLRYQWRLQGVDVQYANQSVFNVGSVRPKDAGAYSVVVSNDYGAVTSAVASLSITDTAPWFRASWSRVRAVPGQDVSLRVNAVGSEPISYQWFYENASLPGETNVTLFLSPLTTNQLGHYSVVASNSFGLTQGPDIEVVFVPGRVSSVIHISVDGLSANYLAAGLTNQAGRFPNFERLQSDGSFTLNARCDYDISVTVPNHLCMWTGRPVLQPAGQPNTVHHGYISDDTATTNTTIHNSGNPNVPYKASVYDVAHDRGLRTGFFVSKPSLAVCPQSYNDSNGAPDSIPPDNGRSKIDVLYGNGYASNVVSAFLPSLTNGAPFQYAFLHLAEMDSAGHLYHWGSSAWFDALETVDAQIGRILSAVETNSKPAIALETALIVTADHGGDPIAGHGNPALEYNYTIPLFVWAPGFETGTDLYGFFANRADPGTNRLDYNAVWQPLRNGDTGNLALSLLGLPPIPGSTLIPLFPTTTPSLSVMTQRQAPVVQWSAAAVGFVLESSASLGPDALWTPVTTGIVTNVNGFSYELFSTTGPQFFRLRK